MRYKILLVYCFTSVCLFSCGQIKDPLRDKIVFEDDSKAVADSIAVFQSLIKKLPKGEMVNSFTDRKANLFVNNKKLGKLHDAIKNDSIRRDSLFENFTDLEYRRFIALNIYLLTNHIDASRIDNISGLFVHNYRRTDENRYRDLRLIFVGIAPLASGFTKHYQVIDKQDNIILGAPSDVSIK